MSRPYRTHILSVHSYGLLEQHTLLYDPPSFAAEGFGSLVVQTIVPECSKGKSLGMDIHVPRHWIFCSYQRLIMPDVTSHLPSADMLSSRLS